MVALADAEAWLAFANELADAADALSLPAFRRAKDVGTKDDGTVVTETDVAVERTIRAMIQDRYPDHAILGEEDGLSGDPDAPRWVVDPIDGTRNFVGGNPIWATLIALQLPDPDPTATAHEVVGVVSAPALAGLDGAGRWDGVVHPELTRARARGVEVRVSDRPLHDGEVSFGGLNYFYESGIGDGVGRLARATRRQRGYGDFWQHCLVAQGVIEAAIEAAVSPWDLAAVKCVVEAAGGRFSDLAGNRSIDGGNCLSTNGRVHDEVLALVHG